MESAPTTPWEPFQPPSRHTHRISQASHLSLHRPSLHPSSHLLGIASPIASLIAPPGWYVGQVEGQVATGADKGKFKVKYKGQRNFEAHELLKADYGVKNVWVILVPPKGGNDCAQLL
jgi:hypothetical protein